MRLRSTVHIIVGLFAVLTLVAIAHAQTAPAPGAPTAPSPGVTAAPAPGATAAPPAGSSEGFGAAGSILIVLLGLLVVVGAGVKFYDLRRKREAEAVHLQAQVSDALLRDPGLFGLAITPTVHVPTWSGSPAAIELTGQVPNPELKESAIRIVRSEAARLRSDFEIKDRLAVEATAAHRAA